LATERPQNCRYERSQTGIQVGSPNPVKKTMSVTVELDPNSRVARCKREIAAAVDESQKPHTATEHLGILLWEMDWRAELESILTNRLAKENAGASE